MPESSTKCGSCLRANRRHCNVDGIDPAVVRSLLQQKAKLDAERDATIAQLGQASAKLARLEAQTRALQERALILIEEEDKTIAELEAEEAAEAAAAADVPPSPSVDLPSWESFFGASGDAVASGWLLEDPLVRAGQDSSGGIPSVSQGSGGSRLAPTALRRRPTNRLYVTGPRIGLRV